GVLGFLGVGLGAFGAHKLKPHLQELGTLAAWETAVLYHLIHAVAILAFAALKLASPLTGWCWLIGTIIFSGSLYVLALTGIKWLGAITPIGGVLFLAGWLLLVFATPK
ncbi:MAG TPA: DUF423 domain-containing protein, partial [Chthoniobacterales bacterium]